MDLLFTQRPSFHGEVSAGSANYAITREVCDWLAEHVPQGSRTLETGCGYSTVSFLSRSGRHSVYSPFAGEHDLIRRWCASQGIDTSHVAFFAEASQQALPARPREQLDVVLIDGDHAFPAPFIDWYYLADDVAPNGLLLVDDTHLTTGRMLFDFLVSEHKRWRLDRELGKTAVFRRVTHESVALGKSWEDQPYVQDLRLNPPDLPGKINRACRRAASAILPAAIKAPLRKLFG
ncbi:MAG: class I SAM-dependent methyltransferase [Planctomycetia bacterium]